MKRIATANRAIDLFGAGKDGFRAAVPGVSDATYLSALMFNHLQEAVMRTIEQAGLVPSDTDFDQYQTALNTIIQNALGNASNILAVATTQTLLSSMAGDVIAITAAGINVTLPARAGLKDGATFKFLNSIGSGISNILAPAGDSVVFSNGVSKSTIPLGIGDSIEIVKFGTTWIALQGSAQLGSSAAFGSSLAANGRQALPSGLIFQWGSVNANATPGTAAAVTFPLAFTTTVFPIFASNSNGYSTGVVSTNSPSLAGFNLFSTTASNACSWWAIGK
jgi:hypothetical protein